MPERTFALLVSQGLPRAGDGAKARYPWPEIYHWTIKREREKAKEEARPKTMDEARQRREAAEAQIAELTLGERQGSLCSVASFEQAQAATHTRIRGQCLAFPSKFGPQCVGLATIPEAVAVLEGGINDLLADLRGDGRERE